MSFLDLEGKRFLTLGVANRKSVAWAIAQSLEAEGAEVMCRLRPQRDWRIYQRRVPPPQVLGEGASGSVGFCFFLLFESRAWRLSALRFDPDLVLGRWVCSDALCARLGFVRTVCFVSVSHSRL